MTRVGVGNVHGLKTKWVQVEESVSRKGGVLLIVVADHFHIGHRARFEISLSLQSHVPKAVTEEFARLKNIFVFFQPFSRFPPLL